MVKHHHSPDKCTTCTTCMAYCPVAKVTKNFRGPKMTGPAFERFRLLNQGEERSLSYCSNCKNCDIACPNDVPIATLNMLARAENAKINKPKLNEWVVSHGELIDSLVHFVPSWLKNWGMNLKITRQMMGLIGISPKAPLPDFTKKRFRERFRDLKKENAGSKKRVVFFPGCYINIYVPEIGMDLVALLYKAGYDVIVPKEFNCCGLPIVSNGFVKEAEKHAFRNGKELEKWSKAGVPVITACPSCTLMLKREFKDLYPSVQDMQFKPSDILDACEFLMDIIDKGELKLETKEEVNHTALYHAPCHLRAQGIGKTGYELLKMLPNFEITSADAGCCGVSGSYGFKKDKYKIGQQIGAELFKKVKTSDAEYITTECGTCQTQIKYATGKNIIHPISILRSLIK